MISDTKVPAQLRAAAGRMQAALDEHIDVEAGLRELLRRVGHSAGQPVGQLTRWSPSRRLAIFRAWFVLCAALTLYLTWVAVVEYRVHMQDPAFVLPNLAALLAWGGVLVRTWVAWTRVPRSAR